MAHYEKKLAPEVKLFIIQNENKVLRTDGRSDRWMDRGADRWMNSRRDRRSKGGGREGYKDGWLGE